MEQTLRKQSLLSRPVMAVVSATFCQILWGIVFPIIKKCYELFAISDVPTTFIFAGLRFTLAGLVLLLVVSLREGKLPKLDKEGTRSVLFLGTLQTGLVYGFQFMALVRASSINCSIINGTAGLFATIFASLLYPEEKLSLKKVLGLVLGFGGVLFCMLYKGDGVGAVSFAGEGMMVFSVLLFNFSSSFSKKITRKVSPIVASGCNLLVGGMELLLVGLLLGGHLQNGGMLGYSLLLFLAGVSSVCLLLWTALFAHNDVARIAVFQGVNPIAGAVAAALLLGEKVFQTKYVVATLLVVLGILVINSPALLKPKEKPPLS